jgi:replicative DNA helicase
MQIATHAALKQGVPALIFSLEMPHRQLVTRMICGEARIDMARLRQGHLGERDFERLEAATQRIGQAPIFINDQGSIDMSGIRSVARRYRQREGIGLIVVDYLQLIECEDQENRVQQISAISRGLKLLARELDLPIIALSQLSRAVESRPNKRPMLSDLRESGAIEQDADLVMFIYRDDYYNPHSEKAGIAEIIVAKQRNGPVGTAELQFHAAHVRFNDLTLDHLQ